MLHETPTTNVGKREEGREGVRALPFECCAGPNDDTSGSNDTSVELNTDTETQDQGNVTTVPPVAQIALTMGMKTHPECVITLEVGSPLSPRSITLLALLDTGVDVTVISVHVWPPGWPTTTQGQLIESGGGGGGTRIEEK